MRMHSRLLLPSRSITLSRSLLNHTIRLQSNAGSLRTSSSSQFKSLSSTPLFHSSLSISTFRSSFSSSSPRLVLSSPSFFRSIFSPLPSSSSSCAMSTTTSSNVHPNPTGGGSQPHSMQEMVSSLSSSSSSSLPSSSAHVPSSSATSSSSSSSNPVSSVVSSSSSSPSPASSSPRLTLSSLIKLYGPVGVVTYLSIYVSTLSAIYIGITSHLIPLSSVYSIFDALGATEYLQKLGPKAGDFAIAWLTTKLTEPIRLAATVAVTPSIARWVGVKVEERKEAREEKKKLKEEEEKEKEEMDKQKDKEGQVKSS